MASHTRSVENYIQNSSFHDDVRATFLAFIFQEKNVKVAFWCIALCLLVTRSLETTGVAALGLLLGLVLFYCLWYCVTHMFLYVIIWIEKFFAQLFLDK